MGTADTIGKGYGWTNVGEMKYKKLPSNDVPQVKEALDEAKKNMEEHPSIYYINHGINVQSYTSPDGTIDTLTTAKVDGGAYTEWKQSNNGDTHHITKILTGDGDWRITSGEDYHNLYEEPTLYKTALQIDNKGSDTRKYTEEYGSFKDVVIGFFKDMF